MSGHMGIDGNEMADQLARQGPSCPLTGPRGCLAISAQADREVIRGWTNRKNAEYWQSIRGQKQAKSSLKRPSAKRAGELLKLSTNQLRLMTGLITEHCHLKGHLFKLGLVKSPVCDRCKQDIRKALTCSLGLRGFGRIKIQVPGTLFYETVDFRDSSVSRILHFVQSAGLINTLI
jgi:hypothetical protein